MERGLSRGLGLDSSGFVEGTTRPLRGVADREREMEPSARAGREMDAKFAGLLHPGRCRCRVRAPFCGGCQGTHWDIGLSLFLERQIAQKENTKFDETNIDLM